MRSSIQRRLLWLFPIRMNIAGLMDIHIRDSYSLTHFAEIFGSRAYYPGLELLDRPPCLVLDLGAHRGMFSLMCECLLRQRFGTRTTKYCLYEVNASLIPKIKANLDGAVMSGRSFVFCGAVGIKSGAGCFHLDRKNLHGSSVGRDQVSGGVRVEFRNIENDLQAMDLGRPEVVKLDVEGAEIDFVKAYPGILSSASVLLVEYHRGLPRHSDWIELVQSTGLRLLEITGSFPSSTIEIYYNPAVFTSIKQRTGCGTIRADDA